MSLVSVSQLFPLQWPETFMFRFRTSSQYVNSGRRLISVLSLVSLLLVSMNTWAATQTEYEPDVVAQVKTTSAYGVPSIAPDLSEQVRKKMQPPELTILFENQPEDSDSLPLPAYMGILFLGIALSIFFLLFLHRLFAVKSTGFDENSFIPSMHD